jgi:HAD superfamily hydrolase (TIGR01549 family)
VANHAPSKEHLEEHLEPVSFYLGGHDRMPYKPQAAAVDHILQNEDWTRREVLYVGNSDYDMKTARNGGVLS